MANQSAMGDTTGTTGMDQSGDEGQPRNVTYDLISVLYHALQGCETYEMYADDAEQDGHTELAQFFRDAMEHDRHLARRGQELLLQCLQDEAGRGGGRQSSQHMQGGTSGGQMSGGGQAGGRGQMSGGQSSSASQMGGSSGGTPGATSSPSSIGEDG